MIKDWIKSFFLNPLRKIFKVQEIIGHTQYSNHLLQALRNQIFIANDSFIESTTFKRSQKLVSLLSPMDVDQSKYRRVGKKYDGGYIMLDGFQNQNITAAYSFGINDDVSWDEQIADFGIPIFMYDHTIPALPKAHPKFNFFKEGVTGYRQLKNCSSLGNIIRRNNHLNQKLLLKMDIESSEWDVFLETPSEILSHFVQINIELHGLTQAIWDPNRSDIFEALEKINKTHQSIHVHANGSGSIFTSEKMVVPDLLEVTYILKNQENIKFIPNERHFPTEIDHPTLEGMPDIYLGKFKAPEGKLEKI